MRVLAESSLSEPYMSKEGQGPHHNSQRGLDRCGDQEGPQFCFVLTGSSFTRTLRAWGNVSPSTELCTQPMRGLELDLPWASSTRYVQTVTLPLLLKSALPALSTMVPERRTNRPQDTRHQDAPGLFPLAHLQALPRSHQPTPLPTHCRSPGLPPAYTTLFSI